MSLLITIFAAMTEAKRVPSLGSKDDRNFRSLYYEKVGFRGVDERKAIEAIFNENPVSVEKCCSFALKCSIPSCDRLQAWKIMLGVAPRYAKNKESCWKWKVKAYEDNLRFMKSAGLITETMSKAQSHAILWLLFNGGQKYDLRSQLNHFWPMNFTLISQSMFEICKDQYQANDIEVFYLTQGLTDILKNASEDTLSDAMTTFHKIMSEDYPKLNAHLDKIGFCEKCPVKNWICRGFAGILSPPALEKIWDKVIGGSLKILVFVAVALFESCQLVLLSCQTSQEAVKKLSSVILFSSRIGKVDDNLSFFRMTRRMMKPLPKTRSKCITKCRQTAPSPKQKRQKSPLKMGLLSNKSPLNMTWLL